MRLRAEQLADRLQSRGLDPVYIISGDEPLQVLECADSIRHFALENQYEERLVYEINKDFDWNILLADAANISLFSSKRLIELRLDDSKPGREGGAVLAEYAAGPPTDTVLLITAAKLDRQTQKSKWYSALDKAGVSISVWPIDVAQLPRWIRQRATQQGKSISQSAAEFIAQQIEGNLLAARQEIDKLCLLVAGDEIEMDDVVNVIADATRFNVFNMIGSAMNGDLSRTRRMLASLQSEGVDVAPVLGALMWELRLLCAIAQQVEQGMEVETACQKQRIWDNARKASIKTTLRRYRTKNLHGLLQQASRIDRQIKGPEREMVWDSMLSVLFALGGKPVSSSVLY